MLRSSEQQVHVILGPTASGKSALAHALAKNIGAEIISADSRQIYRELDIGSAKPSPEALRDIRHHFINEKNIGETFTAGDFAIESRARIREIHSRGLPAVVTGGSTLYLEGLLEGFAELPPGNPEIRKKLLQELESIGKEELYKKLLQKDPQQAATLDATKTQRLIRSLEIIEITGVSVTELQAQGISAADLVNTLKEAELEKIISEFGEERFARRIAAAIVMHRARAKIATTKSLADIILRALPKGYTRGRIHPATRTFQAIRIAVNGELDALAQGLEVCFRALKKGGRLCVITFHSLEDRLVKNKFKSLDLQQEGVILTKRPLTASFEECAANPRSRSAKLRAIERVG